MKHFCSFSEAIREGAKLRPQSKGLYSFALGGTIDGSCAIGAGFEAMGGDPANALHVYDEVDATYPYMARRASCPKCHAEAPSYQGIIIHLNDDHKWTREQIADWLEAEEEKLGFVTLYESESESSSTLDTQVVSV